MADNRIAGLTAITDIQPLVDLIPIVDVSDNQATISGTTKKITISQILAAGGNVVLPQGTAAAPAASFTGDGNTGIFSIGADIFGISVGGVTSATFSNTGLLVAGTVSGTQLISTVATGTAPLSITSTTLVSNLNADRVDGQHASYFLNTSSEVQTKVGTLNVTESIATINLYGSFAAFQTAGGIGYRWTLSNDASFRLQYTTDGFSSVATPRIHVSSAGQIGLGVAPSGQGGGGSIQMADASAILSQGKNFSIVTNGYFDTSWKCYTNGNFTQYYASDGKHIWWNGSGTTAALTPVQAMTLDASGNLGLGVTPSAWNTGVRAAQFATGAIWGTPGGANDLFFGANMFLNASSQLAYVYNGFASRYTQSDGKHIWQATQSGTAGNAVSGFTTQMTLDASGNLGINEALPASKLHVKGTGVNIVSIVDSSATGYSGITFKGTGTQAYAVGVGGPSETAFSAANSFYIYDGLAGTMRLRIDPVGNFALTSKTISVSNLWPKYSVFFGGAQDLNWKKIADITFGTALYSGATLRVEVTDANTNFGGNSSSIPLTYFVSCMRSGAVLNDADIATVSGPVSDYVRVVRTALGVFELQVRQPNDWKHMTFTAQAISVGGGAQTVINYVNGIPQNGSTTGTIYTATASWTQRFPNVSVSGNFTSGYGTFASPAYVVGDSQYGIYSGSGILYYKNSSAGAHYWRNAADTANLMSLDSSGNFLVGPGGAQYTTANRGNITVAGTGEALFGLSVNNTPSGYLWGTTTNVEIGAPAGRYITFSINGEKVRVQNDGNVGIGTSSAVARLQVEIQGASILSSVLAKMGGGDNDFKLVARNGSGPAVGNAESARFGLEYQPLSASGTFNSGIRFFRGGAANDGYMIFATSGVDRMTFTAAGVAQFASNISMNAGYQFQSTDGTVSLPGFSFSADTNTGIYRPTTDSIGLVTNGAERLRADASGNVIVNTAAVATNATSGFLWIPSCAGTPTGNPTAPYTNAAALVWDRTNKKLFVYDGSWNQAIPAV